MSYRSNIIHVQTAGSRGCGGGSFTLDASSCLARSPLANPCIVTFRPGRSGNPQGARLGSRHRTSVLLDKMMQHEAKDIGKVAIERARGGDMTAIKILLDRLSPVPRGRFLRF